jgi:hypothetical protein
MWLPFNPCGGMPYESHFLFNSEVWPVSGFLFPSDSLRPHTSTFYHLAFLLGEALGIGGSFVPFQIVYAALWWARGYLLYLILRRVLPGQVLFAFFCGALVIVHASDRALMWVGQLNQFGFMFWMLLAFYLFVRALQSAGPRRSRWFLAGAIAAQHMSLWSYESPLPLILFAPVALLLSGQLRARAHTGTLAAWYIVPALYLTLTVHKYVTNIEASYQSAVLRSDWTLAALATDLWFNMVNSLLFWRWSDNLAWDLPEQWLGALSLLGMAVFAAGSVGVLAFQNVQEKPTSWPPRQWLVLLLLSAAALLLSFPAYLLLDSAASLWRTQFLSGIAAALLWGSLAALAASLLPGRWLRAWIFLVLGAAITSFGVGSAVRLGAFHDQIWSRHRQAVDAMLTLAPRLPEGAIVVAVDVPKANDPFGANMWFNFALKLAYPGMRVGGIYFYDDGTAASGNHLRLESAQWVWDGSGESPGFRHRGIERSVIVQYESAGKARIADEPPALLSPDENARAQYAPRAVIQSGPPSPRAVRRYYPCSQWWTLSAEPR